MNQVAEQRHLTTLADDEHPIDMPVTERSVGAQPVAERRHAITLTVNDLPVSVSVTGRRVLCDLLREDLGLTGTHVGCGTGACGACTVIIDGQPVRSCLTLAAQADGTRIETIESVCRHGHQHPVQAAFQEHHALQCGFCTPGIVMSSVVMFRQVPAPDAAQIGEMLQGHLCRCTGYRNIVEALSDVASANATAQAGVAKEAVR